MSSGKRSDINFSRFEEKLSTKGVLSLINRNNLCLSRVKVLGTSIEDIEKKVIKERITSFKVDPAITDDNVKDFIKLKLVSITLTKERIENETVNHFEKRVLYDAKSVKGFQALMDR